MFGHSDGEIVPPHGTVRDYSTSDQNNISLFFVERGS